MSIVFFSYFVHLSGFFTNIGFKIHNSNSVVRPYKELLIWLNFVVWPYSKLLT